jgi:hypothetical protein
VELLAEQTGHLLEPQWRGLLGVSWSAVLKHWNLGALIILYRRVRNIG